MRRGRDDRLAAAIAVLLAKYPRHERGLARAWAVLADDLALSAFFGSVNGAGEDGWEEERLRVGVWFARRNRDVSPELRQGMSRRATIRALLPVWRRWGAELLLNNSLHS